MHLAVGNELLEPIESGPGICAVEPTDDHQVNGGIDGVVQPAIGRLLGGAPRDSALNRGYAVISSDAGHDGKQNPWFGLDPQARLDYGYNAVATLTPMAKAMIRTAYGKPPDDAAHRLSQGKIYMVHSGAFYEVEKKLLEPGQLPDQLHWFKWQNGITWLTGIRFIQGSYYVQ